MGGWLIDPALGLASRGDTAVRLRPQLADLLEQLALRANQTVSKDDLLDAVWADKYIAEAGVARCIAELRQLLGDDPREPVFIQTVPKRGYRLVAPVAFVDVNAVPAPGRADSPGQRDANEDVPMPEAPRRVGTAEGRPSTAVAGPTTPRRSIWFHGAAVIGFVAVMATVFYLRVPASWRNAVRGAPQERDLVVLALDRSGSDAAWSEAVRVATALGLEQAARVRVMSDLQAGQILAYMGRRSDEPLTRDVAREVCERAGSPAVVVASVARSGAGSVVSLEAEACGTGETLARGQASVGAGDDLRAAAGRVASSVGEDLRAALQSTRDRPLGPLAPASTSSLPALRALSLGDAERVRGNAAEAVRLYLRAIDLDPQFATAYARLGSLQTVALTSTFPTTPATRPESDDSRKADYLRRAYQLRGQVSEPERFHISALHFAWVDHDPARALEVLESWRKLYPGSTIPIFEMSRLHSAFFGQYDKAVEESREALRLVPGDVTTLIALIDACLGTGRVDEAREYLRQASTLAPDLFAVRLWRYALAVLAGDDAAAEETVDWSRRDPVIRMEFVRLRAQREMAAGRFREAAVLWHELRAWSAERGYRTSVAGANASEALCRAWVGLKEGVARAAREATESSDHPVVQLEAGVALALSGDVAAAGKLADRLRSTYSAENLIAAQVLIPTLEAAIALGRGRPDEAIERLRLAEPYELAKAYRLLPLALRARACLAAGRWTDAIAASSRLASNRAVHPTTLFYPLAYRDLARAYRRTGDGRRADEAEQRFKNLWNRADADLVSPY